MALHNPPADRQADARAGIFVPRVQALKDLENALRVLRVDADAVVSYREPPGINGPLGVAQRSVAPPRGPPVAVHPEI